MYMGSRILKNAVNEPIQREINPFSMQYII